MNPEAMAQIQTVVHAVLSPGLWLMERAGLHPIDLQVWALYVVAFMLALGGVSAYGDILLMHRQVRTKGTVTRIDRDDIDTPRIAFRDARGETHEFASNLPLRPGADAIGDSIAVVYDPLNPRRAREAGRPLAKGFAIVVWYGVAVFILVYAIAGWN